MPRNRLLALLALCLTLFLDQSSLGQRALAAGNVKENRVTANLSTNDRCSVTQVIGRQ